MFASLGPSAAPRGLARPRARLALETLEGRAVPAVALVNGVLHITGTPGPDRISLYISVWPVVGDLHGQGGQGPYMNVFGATSEPRDFFTASVQRIIVDLGGGDDMLDAGSHADDILTAGYFYPPYQPMTVYGRGGNDTINTGGGDDWILGGEGNDTIHGGDGANVIQGEAGNDVLRGGSVKGCVLWGGPGNDTLYGGYGNDGLDGGPGADKLFGEGGNDALRCGPGDDEADGGPGDDGLAGEAGADRLLGGTGRDQLFGGPGADALDGGDGNDILTGGVGADVLTGGDGADVFLLQGADTVTDHGPSDASLRFADGRRRWTEAEVLGVEAGVNALLKATRGTEALRRPNGEEYTLLRHGARARGEVVGNDLRGTVLFTDHVFADPAQPAWRFFIRELGRD
ncbi:MAG: calcium-binding protein [Gemmataceae bacterium]